MRKFFFILSSLISAGILLSSSGLLQSKSNGSIVGYSGAPKATSGFELTCTNCHGGTVNTGPHSVSIAVNGNPSGYQPGQTYSITAKILNPTGSRAGFSLVCLDPAKANCGTFTVGTGTRIVSSASTGRSYINHSGTSLKTWTFSWTAPSTNVPDSVTFYMAGLEVTTADNVYTGKLVFRKQVQSAPILNTSAISNLTQTTATDGGTITSDGGQPVTQRGVCWSTNPGPTTSLNTKTSDGTGTGTFSSSITGLSPSTTYHLRSYAVNSLGTSYGQEITFSTPSCQYLGNISGSSTVTCSNPSTTLSISGAGTFLWSTGQTGAAITVSPTVATTYSVIGSLGNGCSDTVSIAVNVDQNSPPVPVVSAPSAAFCAKSQAIASSAPSGNQWSLNGLPLSGAASQYYWPLQSGAFSVTVTNPINGCSSTAQVAVPVTVLPLPVISQQPEAQTVPAGASAQFVLVTEGIPNILRWQSGTSGQFSDLTAAAGISGVNNDTLNIVADASLNGRQFRCIVSDGTCQDTTAAVSLSVLTSVKASAALAIRLQPNPARQFIRFSGTGGAMDYRITGTDGKLLLSGTSKEGAGIALGGLLPGCYFWHASGASGQGYGRLIIEP